MKNFYSVLFITIIIALMLLPKTSITAADLLSHVKGRILLQVELHGEAWYVHPDTGSATYLRNGDEAYTIMRIMSLGISDEDIAKIPIGIADEFIEIDSDEDGLPDKLEEGLGTDINNPDSDGDGHLDGTEVMTDYNPLGPDMLVYNQNIINRVKGKIILQVENRGQAWYVHPDYEKRYYMKDGETAYNMMRYFGLGITNADIANIERNLRVYGSDIYRLTSEGVYFGQNTMLAGADSATFEFVEKATSGSVNLFYAKDEFNVYVNDTLIEDAYAATFEVIEPTNRFYSKDSNYVYLTKSFGGTPMVETITNSDPDTFEVLEKTGFAKDKNHVYYSGSIIQNADPATFEFIGDRYTKDENNIFFSYNIESNIVEGADRDTFEEYPEKSEYAKDINYVYYLGEILEGEDPATFQP